MTEHTKRPGGARSRLILPIEPSPENEPSGNPSPMQDAEAQMRRALGLSGMPRRQDAERTATPTPPRQVDRFGAGGHKRRFAQDGDVPVTVLHGRQDHPAPVNRRDAAETVATVERTARERAERALAEAQATIRDLQTKLGHASLAQAELQAAMRRHQDAIAAVQAELGATRQRLTTADAAREKLQQQLNAIEAAYAEEQNAWQQAERARRGAEAARTDAVRRLRLTASGSGEPPTPRTARPPNEASTAATRPRAKARPVAGAPEPEPVKWWLMSVKKSRRR